jgi:DtxR family transcriptional regulator, Mn-dependent transcriptional regulator
MPGGLAATMPGYPTEHPAGWAASVRATPSGRLGIPRNRSGRSGQAPYDAAMSGYHPAVEEYLETILELEESGILPLRARIVERLGVSAPAVSETVKRLEREGYLTLGADRVMTLTDSGRTYGTAIMRRHRLAERLLTDVLHVPWHQVHEEAGRLEHAISANLEQHLVALLGDPATCPHGNPIPGSANAVDVGPLRPLADIAPPGIAIIRRIDEELEAQREEMLHLEQAGLMPGATVKVQVERPGSTSTDVAVSVAGRSGRLRDTVAAKIYVTTVHGPAVDHNGSG